MSVEPVEPCRSQRWSCWLSVCAVAAVLLVCAPQAEAHALSLYAGGLGGYGVVTDGQRGFDPYGLALGLDAGVTLPVIPIYVGARGLWFEGTTQNSHFGSAWTSIKTSYLTYGIDLGYEAELGPLVLRPSLGVGRISAGTSGSAGGGAAAFPAGGPGSSLYLSPGAALLVKLGLLYVGGEARYQVSTRHGCPDALVLLAKLGVTL
ncbi:MAG TPA: hypothetical protein VF331_16490 [Polyangiales bacterium]